MGESRFYYLLSRLWASCASFENRIGMLFGESILFGSARNFWNKLKISFRYCFFMRLAYAELPPGFLDSGKVSFYLKGCYKIYEKRIICFLGASKASYLSKELKKEFYSAPVKMGSIIVVFSILVNIVLSVIFKKETSLFNRFIQGLFLATGLGVFSCEANWETIKKSSVVFNKIFK